MNETSGVLQLRENIVRLYKNMEFLLQPLFRFAVSLGILLLLRKHLGVHISADMALSSTLLNVIIALVCSMLPAGFTVAVLSLVMLLEMYRLSLEAAAICAALLFLCILLYFRFSPRDAIVLMVMPVAFALNLHYAVPVIAGLLFSPGAAVAVVFGLLFTRFVLMVEQSLPVIGISSGSTLPTGERMITNFRTLVDGLVNDRELLVLAVCLALTTIVVCFVRHLLTEHAWTAAIAIGCIMELLMLLAGDMRFETNIDLIRVFIGILLAFLLAQIVRFFVFNVDYLHVETVQFEDEDYYYYVKAVPKTMAAAPAENVEYFSRPEGGEKEQQQ